jgi:hypothetical protein
MLGYWPAIRPKKDSGMKTLPLPFFNKTTNKNTMPLVQIEKLPNCISK